MALVVGQSPAPKDGDPSPKDIWQGPQPKDGLPELTSETFALVPLQGDFVQSPEYQDALKLVTGSLYRSTITKDVENLRETAKLLPKAAHDIADVTIGLVKDADSSGQDAAVAQVSVAGLVQCMDPETANQPEVRQHVWNTLVATSNIQQRAVQAAEKTMIIIEDTVVRENPDLKDNKHAQLLLETKDPDKRAEIKDQIKEETGLDPFQQSDRFKHNLGSVLSKMSEGFKKHWDVCALAICGGLCTANLIVAASTGGGAMSLVAGTSVAGLAGWPVGVPALALLLSGLVICGGVIHIRRRIAHKKALKQLSN